MNFEREIGNIYRLKVPFMSVYTSVFLIKNPNGNILIDCATTDQDVDEVIIPALKRQSVSLNDIKYLVLTHDHSDHAGGKNRLLQLNPTIKVVDKIQKDFIDGLTLYELKGHTLNCIGVFDKNSSTLISGDGLQGAGIGKFRCLLDSKEGYLKTIENLKLDKKVENILFSHEYEPWYVNGVFGRKMVEKILSDCLLYVK